MWLAIWGGGVHDMGKDVVGNLEGETSVEEGVIENLKWVNSVVGDVVGNLGRVVGMVVEYLGGGGWYGG